MPSPLETARLRLDPLDASSLRAALAYELAGQPPDWPDAAVLPWLETWASMLESEATPAEWGVWLIRTRSGEIVGDAGFKGAPDDTGGVELAYYVRPGHRRRGFAREAVGAVTNHAWTMGAKAVRAEVHVENGASRAVLQRLGFRQVDAIDDHVWYELRR